MEIEKGIEEKAEKRAENCSFEMALIGLKSGRRIKRATHDKIDFIMLLSKEAVGIINNDELMTKFKEAEEKGSFMTLVKLPSEEGSEESKVSLNYVASTDDLLATDWIVW
jgi:hypothetical protein